MEPEELRRWISANDRTVSGLARELGLGRRTVQRYLNGELQIPRTVELALQALGGGPSE